MEHSIGSYTSEKMSVIHRMESMTKVVSALLIVISVAVVKDINIAAAAFLFSVLMVIISRLPIRFVLKRIWSPFLFILIFAAALLLSTGADGSEILWSIGFIDITEASAAQAGLILIRATAAILVLTVLLATTRFDDIVKVLYDLKMPIFLLQILMFSYRYIFVFADELETMKNSMAAKGFRPNLSMRMFSSIANMLGMLLIKSFERGDEVYKSMIAKGYTGKPAILTANNMRAADYICISIVFAAVVLIHVPALINSGILNPIFG
jgi:cobalt ABC transporter, permease protein CbiQ